MTPDFLRQLREIETWGTPLRTTELDLQEMQRKGWIARVGNSRIRAWIVTEAGKRAASLFYLD